MGVQASQLMRKVLPPFLWQPLETGLGHFLLLMAAIMALLAVVLGVIYYHQYTLIKDVASWVPQTELLFVKIFAALVFLGGIVAWWLVLTS